MKRALITGITGQDGSYLAEFLIAKGYEVHGIKRKSSSLNTDRIDHLYADFSNTDPQQLTLHYGDLSDGQAIAKLIGHLKPDEIYNLAAQSHVAVSFELPEYTCDVNGMGTLRILEGIKTHGLTEKCRFYQASSSELFGLVQATPQNENTPFHPRSPYAVAKLFAFWITKNYRESYGLFGSNGILFNHESPRRGETFVTRKITRGLCRLVLGLESQLTMGNLDAMRDWGHARDYVEMQWQMLQHDKPLDLVISSGRQMSVRDFIRMTSEELGFTIEFDGTGENEFGFVSAVFSERAEKLIVGQRVITVSPKYFRPAEVDTLLGDSANASKILGWKASTTIEELCKEMVETDWITAQLDAFKAVKTVAK